MGEGYVKVGKTSQLIAVIHQRAALDSTAWEAVICSDLCQADPNIGVHTRRVVYERRLSFLLRFSCTDVGVSAVSVC